MVSVAEAYRCPRTGRVLVHQGNTLRTLDGAVRYPIVRGVPDFRLEKPTDLADEQQLAEMTEAAGLHGWRSAVLEHRPATLAYVDDPARTQFLDRLPLTSDAVALEIGSGLGQILVPLARRVASAFAVELSPGQAQFTRVRCAQEGVDNAFVSAGGDDLLLPFADGRFDVVILNHVLEWAKTSDAERVTRDQQALLLREVRRVLRPGGVLFVGTKNRHALRLLLGDRDENARGIRFGHALPRRWVARLARHGDGVLGLLHSHRGLAALLRETGLVPEASYWAGPDSRYPKWYVPTDPSSVRAARRQPGFEQGATRKARLVMPWVPARGVKHVAPGLAFVARRPGSS